jgi:hypothetical protein
MALPRHHDVLSLVGQIAVIRPSRIAEDGKR